MANLPSSIRPLRNHWSRTKFTSLNDVWPYLGIGRRIARRDASGTVYYFITDHIGNVRVVANASGGVVEESDYLPFGTENVITSTLDNNYKFIGMEPFGFAQDRRNYEGTAALERFLTYPCPATIL